MDKSHNNRFRLRNLGQQNHHALNLLPDIYRCSKCNRYNDKNLMQKCIFCGNPIYFFEKGAK